jgi:hypothetical protein
MAILVPDIEEINSLPQKPTEGEIFLMEALCKTLDPTFRTLNCHRSKKPLK